MFEEFQTLKSMLDRDKSRLNEIKIISKVMQKALKHLENGKW